MYIKIPKLTIFIIFVLTHFFSLSSIGQSHYLLSSFKAEKSVNRVILNWSIKQGSTCIGINILRSNDTINFKEIGNIQGICGSTEFEQRYTYIDENPLPNQTNYYKLELGFSGRTEPALKINFVQLENNDSKVVPNPNHGFGTIYVYNPNHQRFSIYITDNHGRFVDTYVTDEDKVNFDVTHETKNPLASMIPSNIYNYAVLDENNKIVSKGQIVVKSR